MISLLALSACGKSSETHEATPGARPGVEPMVEPLAPGGWADAAGGFVNRENQPAGYVAIAQAPGAGILMRVDLKGLSQGWHGIHLHQVGDCSDYEAGFKASGGHVDPDAREHGLLNPEGPEAADLSNIYAGPDGRATAEIYNGLLALFPSEAASAAIGPHRLIDEDGFAVIVHLNADDHITQPIGGAGERVACAAIKAGF